MNRSAKVWLGLLILSLCGCPSRELTLRYKSARVQGGGSLGAVPSVTVSAFVLTTPENLSPVWSSMGPEGQAAFVTAVAERSKSLEDMLGTLAGTSGTPAVKGDTIDQTTFRKRVVFSAEKDSLSPGRVPSDADRICQLQVTLEDPGPAKFVSWDKFNSDYRTIDLGKITLGKAVESQFGLAAEGTNPVIKPSASVGFKQNLSEEVTLRQRYVGITGKLSEKKAEIYQEGVVGIDLTGNFTVDLVLRVEHADPPWRVVIPGALAKDGRMLEPDEVQIQMVELTYPKGSDPIQCHLNSAWWLRHVKKKRDTIDEGDDQVLFIRGQSNPGDIKLIDTKELATRVYRIMTYKRVALSASGQSAAGANRPTETSTAGWQLHAKGDGGGPLDFYSSRDAVRFLEWAQDRKATHLARYSLEWSDRAIVAGDLPYCTVEGYNLN